jgi:hypothetical protein
VTAKLGEILRNSDRGVHWFAIPLPRLNPGYQLFPKRPEIPIASKILGTPRRRSGEALVVRKIFERTPKRRPNCA